MNIRPWFACLAFAPALFTGCAGSSCFKSNDSFARKKDSAPPPAWQAAAKSKPVPANSETVLESRSGTTKSLSTTPLNQTPAAIKVASRPEAIAPIPAPIQRVAATTLPDSLPSAPGVPATSLNVPPPPTLILPEPAAPTPEKPAKPATESGAGLPPIPAAGPAMLPPPPGAPSLESAPLAIPTPPTP